MDKMDIEALARQADAICGESCFGEHAGGSWYVDPLGASPRFMAAFAALVAERCAMIAAEHYDGKLFIGVGVIRAAFPMPKE